MSFLNYNGKILRADKEIIKADNRGFRYGDGFFETIRMTKGMIPLGRFHFERLSNALQLLQFDVPAYITPEYLTTQILELANKNNHRDNVRIRLMVFRGDGGLYDPQNHFPNYIIQTWELPRGPISLNENGLTIDVFEDSKIAPDHFSHLKTNNYLPYLMGALFVKKNQLNEAILLNTAGDVCDATIANIFIIKNKKIITPSISQGCVAGVMRRYLLDELYLAGIQTIETNISVDHLVSAEEVFLSNAIYGIKWVRQFRGNNYGQAVTAGIFHDIIRKIF